MKTIKKLYKNLKALALGYVVFEVNGKTFYTYSSGRKFAEDLIKRRAELKSDINLSGFSVFSFLHDYFTKPVFFHHKKGWRGLLLAPYITSIQILDEEFSIEKHNAGAVYF